MRTALFFFFLPALFFSGVSFSLDTTISFKTEIELNRLSDITELVELELHENGYLINNKYWIGDYSKKELLLLVKNGLNYKIIKKIQVPKKLPFFFKEFKAAPTVCGLKIEFDYTITEESTGIILTIFALNGKKLTKKIGYNVPAGDYEFSRQYGELPNGIYIVQIERVYGEILSKVIQKKPPTKSL